MTRHFTLAELGVLPSDDVVEVLVPISGGKDSQASLKLALQKYKPHQVRGLFCDTKFEHPKTYAHVRWMEQHYGVRIDWINVGSVEEKCLKHERFPGSGSRFCTEELKIWPTKWYCGALAREQGRGFEVWYGMRSDESTDREQRYMGKVCDEVYPPHEIMAKYPKYLAKLGVMFRLCVLNWSKWDILDFVGNELNPLYADGFDRVGCFPCQAAGDKHKEKAYNYDEFGREQLQKVIAIARQINRPVYTTKGAIARNPHVNESAGCAICEI